MTEQRAEKELQRDKDKRYRGWGYGVHLGKGGFLYAQELLAEVLREVPEIKGHGPDHAKGDFKVSSWTKKKVPSC